MVMARRTILIAVAIRFAAVLTDGQHLRHYGIAMFRVWRLVNVLAALFDEFFYVHVGFILVSVAF
jgi:hypothetical protein